eukprot:TRINITY_DN12182_c0_g1_i1.p1 TRINITY_DN12182_c0_g1~~TRINITY_DN12182_c0_g1_i1.p1  ORF type:complete len:263 (+),score=43.02 TRINITY_DN12182_c0_g1_i1:77-790(+)
MGQLCCPQVDAPPPQPPASRPGGVVVVDDLGSAYDGLLPGAAAGGSEVTVRSRSGRLSDAHGVIALGPPATSLTPAEADEYLSTLHPDLAGAAGTQNRRTYNVAVRLADDDVTQFQVGLPADLNLNVFDFVLSPEAVALAAPGGPERDVPAGPATAAVIRRALRQLPPDEAAAAAADQCCVCMTPLGSREDAPAPGSADAAGCEVVGLPCHHLFHRRCVEPWLRQRGSCPNCRQVVG